MSHLPVGPSSALTAHSSTFLAASPNPKDSRMSPVWDRTTPVSQSVIAVIATYSHEIIGFPIKLVISDYTSVPQCQMLFIHSTTLRHIGRNVYLHFSFRSCEHRTFVQYARSHLAASHAHSSVRKPTQHKWPDIISRLLTLWWHHFLRIQRRYFNERKDCETKNRPYTTPSAHHRHAG